MAIKLLNILNKSIQEQGGKFKDLVDKQGRKVGDTYHSVEMDNSGNITNVLSVGETPTVGGSGKYILGKKMSIDKNGPANHATRALGNWQSDNATDIFSSPGTTIYSITKGTVSKLGGDQNKHSGKIYGASVTVTGVDGYPNVFYTHMQNVQVSVGTNVDLGTPIGEISNWNDNPSGSHVHVGIEGDNLSSLLNLDTGEIKNVSPPIAQN